ncbi:hypothetical protein RMATCC62417_14876 [Rhizopus microsporus]|nr:hypothetical protein RMATCC62417_14876 [Rhizopus microsporus]
MNKLLALYCLILSVIAYASADFHISTGVATGGRTGVVACPSNYWNCNCYGKGDRAGVVTDANNSGLGNITPDTNFFKIRKGLCGMGEMNFYKRNDGRWEFYANNGDGKLLGTCYENKAIKKCTTVLLTDKLVCYSYICNP